MIGWFIRGVVDLTWTIKYVVQAGRAWIVPFIWLLPLTRLGATESGVDRRILIGIAVKVVFVFVSTRPSIVVLSIRTASIFAKVVAESTCSPHVWFW